MKRYKPVILIIIDGLGIPQDEEYSPLKYIHTNLFKNLEKNFPFFTLQASGIAVGLPWGEAGNSEVGHLTIGAGKIVYNYLPEISTAIKDGSFFYNEAFIAAINRVKQNDSNLHLMGLFSTGTVHAYYEHLYALLDLAQKNNLKKVFLHLFTDGKDAYKKEGADFFAKLERDIDNKYPFAQIASVIGRNFAMERTGDIEKTKRAFELFTGGMGEAFTTASGYIKGQYDKGVYDEAINPGYNQNILDESRIKEKDALIFFNFREDSMRQIVKYFLDNMPNLFIVTMTQYDKNFPCAYAFKQAGVENPLSKIISENGLKQLHIAETEKYAHITYFLNGGREEPFGGEDRILIPSPKTKSYEENPEMSAFKITETVIEKLNEYDFIAINFANTDMVGHTGNLSATIKAIDVVAECLEKIISSVFTLKTKGAVIITSDHGNAEEKIYKFTGQPKSEHSTNPVPLYVVAKDLQKETPTTEEEIKKIKKITSGILADIAPTVLALLGIEKPKEMTGVNLLEKI